MRSAPLGALLRERALRHIDLMSLDLEGGELNALRSCAPPTPPLRVRRRRAAGGRALVPRAVAAPGLAGLVSSSVACWPQRGLGRCDDSRAMHRAERGGGALALPRFLVVLGAAPETACDSVVSRIAGRCAGPRAT